MKPTLQRETLIHVMWHKQGRQLLTSLPPLFCVMETHAAVAWLEWESLQTLAKTPHLQHL